MKRHGWMLIPLILGFFVSANADFTEVSGEDFPEAPDFTLEDLKGNKISLSDMSGKVVILNVWATWCGPCKKEIPDFIEAYAEYKDEGLEIIGISIDNISQGKVLKFTEKYKMNYPVAMVTAQITKDYGPFIGVPVTIIIDKNRKVRLRKFGWVDKKFIEDWFKKLIEEK